MSETTGVRSARVQGTVRIVGAGLLGSSIGHALREHGVDVALDDTSPAQLRLAIDYGAGRSAREDDDPALVVVAVPPDVTADVIERELARFPRAVVTDVASVKLEPLRVLRDRGVDLARYIGSHPLAGRERGGAISARADIFTGRPWVVCRDEETSTSDLALVEGLALDLGATPIEMSPEEHDRAVALVSHVPQIVASLLAGRFADAPDGSLRLAGQGVRDTTRIAASAPELWVQILGGNAAAVAPLVGRLATDLADLSTALAELAAEPTQDSGSKDRQVDKAIERFLTHGQQGHARIPGKHGTAPMEYSVIPVVIPDEPGALGRLFTTVAKSGASVEDISLEHSPGHPVGIIELSVQPHQAESLVRALQSDGWSHH